MSETPEKSALEKLTIILPHLIEHNNAHAGELEKWADEAEAEGASSIAKAVRKAAEKIAKSVGYLHEASTLLTSGSSAEDAHHHTSSKECGHHKSSGHCCGHHDR